MTKRAYLPFMLSVIVLAIVLAGGLRLLGTYDYRLLGKSDCSELTIFGDNFPDGTEIVPGQSNPCYLRVRRFHLP